MKRRTGDWRLEAGGQNAHARASDSWLVLQRQNAWKSAAGRYTDPVAPLWSDRQSPAPGPQPRMEVMP